jgi:Uma2 family endonuclease
MPVILTEPAILETPSVAPRRKKWTREEVDFLATTELFMGARYELIEGELIDKMAQGRPHSNRTWEIVILLGEIFGVRKVQHDVPIDVAPEDNPTSAPEPDVIVLTKDFASITGRFPSPEEIALLVEVCDSSLAFDRSTKADLYARAGIADYWTFDIQGRRLIVHREPWDGHYRSAIAYDVNESVAPLACPDKPFAVRAAFP